MGLALPSPPPLHPGMDSCRVAAGAPAGRDAVSPPVAAADGPGPARAPDTGLTGCRSGRSSWAPFPARCLGVATLALGQGQHTCHSLGGWG